MVRCPSCGAPCEPHHRFCGACASPLPYGVGPPVVAARPPSQPPLPAPGAVAPSPAVFAAPPDYMAAHPIAGTTPGPYGAGAAGAQAAAPPAGGLGPGEVARCPLGHPAAPGAAYCAQGHPVVAEAANLGRAVSGVDAFAQTAPPGGAHPMAGLAQQHAAAAVAAFPGSPPAAGPAPAPIAPARIASPLPPPGGAAAASYGAGHRIAPASLVGAAVAAAREPSPPPAPVASPPGDPARPPIEALRTTPSPGPAPQGRRELAAFLVSFHGDPLGAFFPLYAGRNVVGRAGAVDNLDVALAEPTVSSVHAMLHCDPAAARVALEDAGSTNGTFVGDERIPYGGRRDLRDRERLRFGAFATTLYVLERRAGGAP